MKTLITVAISLIFGLLTLSGQAKDTTLNKENYFRSFIVIDTDDTFKVKVKFMKDMNDEVKSYLENQPGYQFININTNTFLWFKGDLDKKISQIMLKDNVVKLEIDKRIASEVDIENFKKYVEGLKVLTSNKMDND
ncbi:hypothetical protein [Aquimarina algicola]|uniref:Uncharacterized protein n=1 Tax=Aquimarina algicola TaxID=2589995 RepID=A0A504JSA2_9FLAO|nr:hypothetical protein [Aquimarina algicola]TPN89270.1 hypothetical protein FHK87_03310 [Aquimarina algicola]